MTDTDDLYIKWQELVESGECNEDWEDWFVGLGDLAGDLGE